MLIRPLLAPEEERFLLAGRMSRNIDGAAQVVPENILLQGRHGGTEEVAGIQCVVTKIFEGGAMKLIGPALGLKNDRGRAIHRVLSAIVILQNADLLDTVRIGSNTQAIHIAGGNVPDPVQVVPRAGYSHAVDRHRVDLDEPTLDLGGIRRRVGYTGHESGKALKIPPVQGKGAHFFTRYFVRDLGSDGLNLHSTRRDLHLLGDGPDRDLRIDRGDLRGVDLYTLFGVRPETLLRHRDRIHSDRQRRTGKCAVGVAGDGDRGVRAVIDDGDGGRWHNGSALIGHRTGNRA